MTQIGRQSAFICILQVSSYGLGRSTFNVKAAGNHDETPRAESPCQDNSKVDGMELRPGMPDPARGEAHAKQCHQTYGRYPQGSRRFHHIHPQNGSVTERYYRSLQVDGVAPVGETGTTRATGIARLRGSWRVSRQSVYLSPVVPAIGFAKLGLVVGPCYDYRFRTEICFPKVFQDSNLKLTFIAANIKDEAHARC